MRVSSRADYALSCILRIAEKRDRTIPVTVREVARQENIETDYVEQLFVIMKKAGILKSIRGKNGGYLLAAPADKITAKDVVKAIDKDVLDIVCYRKKGRKNKCVHLTACEIKSFWEGLKENMELFLEKHTLEMLLKLRRNIKKLKLEGVKK